MPGPGQPVIFIAGYDPGWPLRFAELGGSCYGR
jgi:hypothetical protein